MLLVAVGILGMYAPHVLLLWAVLTLAALMIATGTLALLAIFGSIGQLLAMILLIYLSIASAGGTVPIQAQLPIVTSNIRTVRQRPNPEVPLRVLIDKALTRGYVLSPLAAPHHRRDGLVFRWPSDKGTQVRPSPDGGRGHHRLTYGQVWDCRRRPSRSSPNLRTSGLRCPATQACRRKPPFLVRRVQRDGQFVVGVNPV